MFGPEKGQTSPIVAVGFDLGDTLLTYAGVPLDWSSHYGTALQSVAESLSVSPDRPQFEEAARILSRYNTRLNPRETEVSASVIFEEIFRAWNLELSPNCDRAITAFFDFFQQQMTAYPDSVPLLRMLRLRQVRIGILTDVPYGMPHSRVETDLQRAQIAGLVDITLTSVEVGWRKPHPQGFRALADKLAVDPAHLWYVGNEQKDIIGATRLGMVAVLVDREKRRPDWGQRYTVANLTEVAALFTLQP